MAFQSNNGCMADSSAPMNGSGMDGQFPGAPNMQATTAQAVTNEAARTLWYVSSPHRLIASISDGK